MRARLCVSLQGDDDVIGSVTELTNKLNSGMQKALQSYTPIYER